MKRISYTSHALVRLETRNIDKSEVSRILESPQKLYFDIVTGALVAIGPRMVLQGHWLIIVYTVEDDMAKIITVIDTSSIDNFIKLVPRKPRALALG